MKILRTEIFAALHGTLIMKLAHPQSASLFNDYIHSHSCICMHGILFLLQDAHSYGILFLLQDAHS